MQPLHIGSQGAMCEQDCCSAVLVDVTKSLKIIWHLAACFAHRHADFLNCDFTRLHLHVDICIIPPCQSNLNIWTYEKLGEVVNDMID